MNTIENNRPKCPKWQANPGGPHAASRTDRLDPETEARIASAASEPQRRHPARGRCPKPHPSQQLLRAMDE